MPRRKTRVEPQSQTVDRALSILKMIAAENEEMSVTEIANRLEIYPSVVSRLITTLEYHNLLRQNPHTRRYWLGLGLVELGSKALDSIDLVEVAKPMLQHLSDETAETVFLMILDRDAGVYVAKMSSPKPIAIQSEVGHREPLHSSAVGKSLVAFLPEDERNRIVERVGLPKLTPNTITDPEQFHEELANVRAQGYAIDNEEGEVGIRCIGAPIFNHNHYPIASVSISTPAFRTPLERLLGWRDALLAATQAISHELGYIAQTEPQASSGK